MKETTQEYKDAEIEIRVEQQQRKELKLLGHKRKIRGHTLFEYCFKTREIKPAQYKKQTVEVHQIGSKFSCTVTHTVIVNEGCYYFQSLNLENAKKIIRKTLKINL